MKDDNLESIKTSPEHPLVQRVRLIDLSSHIRAEFYLLQPIVKNARLAYSQPVTEALLPKVLRGHCSMKTWSYSKSNSQAHTIVKLLLSSGQSFPGSSLSSYLLRCCYGLLSVLKLQVSSCALHQISLEVWEISIGILVKLFILLRDISLSPLHKLIGKRKSHPEYSTSKTVAFNIDMYIKVRKHLQVYCKRLSNLPAQDNLELHCGKKDYILAFKFTGFSNS